MQLTIRKSGNLIDISQDGNSALPDTERRLIEPLLTYTFQQRLYGLDRIDPLTGLDRPMRFETRRLYRYDGQGRLCCGSGLLSKIYKTLTAAGYSINVVTNEPPYLNANRYEADWDGVFETFEFRPRQRECLEAIANNSCGVISAPTGFGKGMIIAMTCALYPKAKIHVVTYRKDVVSKTANLLTKYLPDIGQVGGGQKRYGNRITVFTADSLHRSDGYADFLIADEGHELMTHTRSQELARYRYSRNFTFTATPTGRADGSDAKLESLFGPVIFHMEYAEAAELGLVVPIVVEWLDVKLDDNPAKGKSDVPKKRWGLWRNRARNQIIANKVRQYDDTTQVLILVETVEHAIYLRQHLPEFSLCYANMSLEDHAMYKKHRLLDESDEIVTPQTREKLRRDFEAGHLKKVIATDVWSTGVDFVGLQVLVRADARSSDIMDTQAPGRVCRVGTKQTGIVIDLLDQFDRTFHSKALKRKRNYAAKNWRNNITRRGRSAASTSLDVP